MVSVNAMAQDTVKTIENRSQATGEEQIVYVGDCSSAEVKGDGFGNFKAVSSYEVAKCVEKRHFKVKVTKSTKPFNWKKFEEEVPNSSTYSWDKESGKEIGKQTVPTETDADGNVVVDAFKKWAAENEAKKICEDLRERDLKLKVPAAEAECEI